MTYYGLVALVAGQVGVVLLLVLALVSLTGVRRRAPVEAMTAGVGAIAIGVVLLFYTHWGWGLLGPVGQLRWFPERIAFLKSLGPDRVDYWDFANPQYHSGILAYGFLIGAGAILWSRLLWSRWVILVCSGVLIGLAVLRVAVRALRGDTHPLLSVMLPGQLVLAVGIASLLLVFLCLPRTKRNLSGSGPAHAQATKR